MKKRANSSLSPERRRLPAIWPAPTQWRSTVEPWMQAGPRFSEGSVQQNQSTAGKLKRSRAPEGKRLSLVVLITQCLNHDGFPAVRMRHSGIGEARGRTQAVTCVPLTAVLRLHDAAGSSWQPRAWSLSWTASRFDSCRPLSTRIVCIAKSLAEGNYLTVCQSCEDGTH